MICGISRQELDALLLGELRADAPYGDRTTEAFGLHVGAGAEFVAKQDLVVAGLGAAMRTFELAEDEKNSWTMLVEEGDKVNAGATLAKVYGHLPAILLAERTALNLLQRLCGIATMTARAVEEVAGTQTKIMDTRKTTIGLRNMEKYAVRTGGGCNHRMGLSDGILLKDNHVAAAGSVAEAVHRTKAHAGPLWKVEVEVTDLHGFHEAVSAGADVILLDNMSNDDMAVAVKHRPPGILLEASGGMTISRLHSVAELGVDMISVGMLTHSAPSADISMELLTGEGA